MQQVLVDAQEQQVAKVLRVLLDPQDLVVELVPLADQDWMVDLGEMEV